MGVKGLMSLITKLAPDAVRDVKLKDLKGKTVAVDTMLMIYKYMIAMLNTGNQLTRSDGKATTHLNGFVYKIRSLLVNNITPIFVIDGKPPEIKRELLSKRLELKQKADDELLALSDLDTDTLKKIKLQKRTFGPSRLVVQEVKQLVKLCGLPLIQALGEADPQCAALNITGDVYAVVSDDIDTLLFGAPRMIRRLDSKGGVETDLVKLLKGMKLSYRQFVELGVMLGCDYCIDTIKGVGPDKAYKLIREHGSLSRVMSVLKDDPKYDVSDGFIKRSEEAVNYYLNVTVYDPKSLNLKRKRPDKAGLINMLVNENMFSKERIDKVVDDMMKTY